MRVKYANGETDIVGSGGDTAYLNYYSHVTYDFTTSGKIVPIVLLDAPVPNGYPAESVNGSPVKYVINISAKPLFYQVLNIKISKQNDEFVYTQVMNALNSGDKNLGIKLEYYLKSNKLGEFRLENFSKYYSESIQATYDISYFNNLLGTSKGIYKSKNVYTRLLGYLGYQIEDGDIHIKWGRFYTDSVYGTNSPDSGILLDNTLPGKIFNNDIPNPIFDKPVVSYNAPNFDIHIVSWKSEGGYDETNPNIHIFNIHFNEYSDQEPCFQLFKKYSTIILTTNFFFGNKIPCLELEDYVLLDIEELNNKDSNNQSFSKSFVEIPLNTKHLSFYDATNLGYGTKYFNPPLKNIDRLTIKLKDTDGDVLKKPNYSNDFTFIFNIKQINNGSNIVIM